jgi:hypothetical protein
MSRTKENMTTLEHALDRAKKFNAGRRWNRTDKIPIDPHLLKSPSIRKALDGMMSERGATREEAEDALMRAHNLGEILTVEELAGRLKVTPAWVKHRRRSRSKNKIPALDILGRPLRFDWDAVVKWLEGASQVEEMRSPRRKKA